MAALDSRASQLGPSTFMKNSQPDTSNQKGSLPPPTRGHGYLEVFLSNLRAQKADSLIPDSARSGRILDIGCGPGARFLAQVRFKEKHGIDKALRAEGCSGGISLHDFDIAREGRLPFGDDYFDVVTMLAVFEHIEPERLPLVLGEIRRVLRPGGVFIMTTPAWWADGVLRLMSLLRLVSAEEIADHKDTYSAAKVRGLLAEAGFSAVEAGYFEAFMNIWARAERV